MGSWDVKVPVDVFRGLARFKLVPGSVSDRLDEGFFFFFFFGEVPLSEGRGCSCAEGSGDCGGVATISGAGGDTGSMTPCPSLTVTAVADFLFGFFFFFFLGAVGLPSSSSSTSSTVAFVGRCAGAGAGNKSEFQGVG